MGGRSRGCRTCRRRKVKCDQVKPTCKRCQVGRFVCHGYEPYAEFVDETDQFHGGQQSAQSDATLVHIQRPIIPTVSKKDHTILSLLYLLDNIYSSHGSFRHLGWMASVLRHPSTPEPLSWSVCALASVFFGRAKPQSLELKNGVNIYYKALRLVQSKLHGQASIADQDLPLSVLCLCVYEFITPTSPHAWLNHASGLGMIMQLGGPGEYLTGYRRASLHALRYIVILGCLHQRRRCFLEEPAWKTAPWGDKTTKTLLDSLHDIFCDIPGLLSDLQSIVNKTPDNSCRISLHSRVPSTIDSLLRWRWAWHTRHGSSVSVTENQFLDDAPPGLTILHFPDLQRAAELCLYNAILLILVRIADTLGIQANPNTASIPQYDHFVPAQPCSPRQIAEEIVRISPYMSSAQHGNKGIYLLSFPLRIARGRLPTGSELSKWVENKLGLSDWKLEIDDL